MARKYIIDFDSTVIRSESLERFMSLALEGMDDGMRNQIISKVEGITNLGMGGKLSFGKSLGRRFDIFRIAVGLKGMSDMGKASQLLEDLLAVPDEELLNNDDPFDNILAEIAMQGIEGPDISIIDTLVAELNNDISDFFDRNRDFFTKNKEDIFIVSGGFKEWIEPVVETNFGISADNVYANEFTYENERITGFDKTNPLAEKGGKIRVVRNLKERGRIEPDAEIYVIGDGATDYEIVKEREGHVFVAFTDNVRREGVYDKSHMTIEEMISTSDEIRNGVVIELRSETAAD